MEEQLTGNTFGGGLNMDLSDFIIQNNQLRYAENIRIVNYEGSAFVVTNIKGTEVAFQVTSGFVPVAYREHNEVLYLVLWSETAQQIEVGSYPSPDYGDGLGNQMYRPFNNFNNGPFRTSAFNIASKPVVDITIQDDYDRSVNLVLTFKGNYPRIINSKFRVESDGAGNRTYSIAPNRPGNANSNTYTTASVEKETRLVISSSKIAKLDFVGVQSGGRLKPGNYRYVFHYMTEDLNVTEVIAQSSVCQVFFGQSENNIYGGDESQETDKRIAFQLSNLDVDFKYLKVYCLYSAGQEGAFEQYLELTKPVTITGETMNFYHTGFEEMVEVSQDIVNEDYGVISGADTTTQINGYLFLAGIRQFSYELEPFRQFAAAIAPEFHIKELSAADGGGYMNSENTYNFLGHMGNESYAYCACFILPGGVITPAFPIKGKIFTAAGVNGLVTGVDTPNGIVTFPHSNHYQCFDNGKIRVKYLKMNLTNNSLIANGASQQTINLVKERAIGIFFVRADRIPSALTQGLLVPTVRVPPLDYHDFDGIENSGNDFDINEFYYWRYRTQANSPGVLKHVPCIDSIMEAYEFNSRGDGNSNNERYVVDETNSIKDGYMPIFINDIKAIDNNYPDIWASANGGGVLLHWALLSGEAFANEPSFVTSLSRDTVSFHQIAKARFDVSGVPSPLFGPIQTGLVYTLRKYTPYASVVTRGARSLQYVPGGTYATGSDFISKVYNRFLQDANTSGNADTVYSYTVHQLYEPYFGLELDPAVILADFTKNPDNPIGGNLRNTNITTTHSSQTSGRAYANVEYANNNDGIPAGFLINVYPQGGPRTATQLYPTIENLSYRQVTPRFTWNDINAVSGKVDVFGGDCFISKVSRRVNYSPHANPRIPFSRDNIDQGMIVTWWQESRFNLHLRRPYQFDASESEKRSFYPYKGNGNFAKYRSYRLPETSRTSPGYALTLPPKIFVPAPLDVPYIENEFYSRVYVSDKHIPNAYRNGFRNITSNFRDYTSSLGRIVRLFNHRGNLVIVFEYGIGVTSVEQRIQTGQDAAGAIFVEPKDILPPNLAFYTQELGSQQFYSMVQTPQGIYGVDFTRRKIWQITDTFKVISDDGFGSFLMKNPPVNMRSGYDPQNNEVLFTSDNWTLVFREGLEKFTSFYSFRPDFYARRGKEFYSVLNSTFHRHNAEGFQIYGENKEWIVEFAINESLNMTKVLDYLQIVSNEVKPVKIEIFTYNQNTEKSRVINTASLNQYSIIEDQIDPYTGLPRIVYRDKKFETSVPLVTVYNAVTDKWAVKGRMRNIYFIIRLTYNTDKLLQLASVVSSYRFSMQ
jgi:hypothetical protein